MLRIKSRRPSKPAESPATSDEELNRRANLLLDKGDLEGAWPVLTQLADRRRDILEIQTTAGLVAVRLERREDARAYLTRATDIVPDDFDANFNLAFLAIMDGDYDTALARLTRLRKLYPENLSLLNDIAVAWSRKGNRWRALGVYSRALRLSVNDSRARNNAMAFCLENRLADYGCRMLNRQQKSDSLSECSKAEVTRWLEIFENAMPELETNGIKRIAETRDAGVKGQRIAFFATHKAFLTDIMDYLGADNDIRMFEGQTVGQMSDLMAWADIAWFEWCDQLVIEATKLPKTCRIICRLHSYEAFTEMPSQVDWSKVDHLLFVNKSVDELFRQQISARINTSVIHNGVDLNKFVMPENKPDSKKIASVGYINYKKNPALLLYCFKKIYEYDPEYSLHIAGSHQDSRIQLYFDHFLKNNKLPIHFDGWVDDMPAWYADKGFVISTSLFESFHYSVAEGMASGLLPLVHHWYGADYLYPESALYQDPDGCLGLLQKLEREDVNRQRKSNREYITRRFNHADKVREIAALLAEMVESTERASSLEPETAPEMSAT